MKCARCGKWIEKAFWAEEGDFMGKPLCNRCRSQVEEESRERYRKGLAKQHSVKDHYGLDVYQSRSDEDL